MSYGAVREELNNSRKHLGYTTPPDSSEEEVGDAEVVVVTPPKGLYETLMENHELNLEYLYYDNDIDLCLRALLKKLKAKFRDGCEFLVDGPDAGLFLAQDDGKAYIVLCTPTVDTAALMRPIDYYLDTSQQPINVIVALLDTIISGQKMDLKDLSQLKDDELVAAIEGFGDDNPEVVKIVVKILKSCKFNRDSLLVELKVRVDNDHYQDVFTEAMPLIEKIDSANLKILMPFNVTDSHWMLCEIRILKNGPKYQIIPSLHDPKASRSFTDQQLEKIRVAVTKRIKQFDPKAEIDFIMPDPKAKLSPARQLPADITSCGPIIVDDWENRIQGKPLRVTPFQIGAPDLRVSLLKLVETHFAEDSTEIVINFIDRNLKTTHENFSDYMVKVNKPFNTEKYRRDKNVPATDITATALFQLNDPTPPAGNYLTSSVDLADFVLTTTSSDQRSHALSIADRAIGLFNDPTCNKNWEEIVEVLTFARVPDLQNRLNRVMFNAVWDDNSSSRIVLLNGFIEANRLSLQSNNSKVDQDAILLHLKLINKILTDLHSRNPNITNLRIALTGMCQVIDTLVDLKFSGLKKFDLKNPLYDCLSRYSSHKDPEIAFLANYALQGLVRIESDETSRQRFIRKLTLVVDAVGSVGAIASSIATAAISGGAAFINLFSIPSNCLKFYQSVDKLISFKIKPDMWYDQVRAIDDLLRNAALKDEVSAPPAAAVSKKDPKPVGDLVSWEFLKGFVYKLESLIERKPAVLQMPSVVNCIHSIFNRSREISSPDIFSVTLSQCDSKSLNDVINEIGVQKNVFHLIYVQDGKIKKHGKWYYYHNMNGKKKLIVSNNVSSLTQLSEVNKIISSMNYDQLKEFMRVGINYDHLTNLIAHAFEFEAFSVNDAWIVGRLSNLILQIGVSAALVHKIMDRFDRLSGIGDYLENKTAKQNFGVAPDMAQARIEAFDKLYAEKNHKATHDDHLRCIKDCLALIIFEKNQNLQAKYIKDLCARYLSVDKGINGIEKKLHPFKHKAAVSNIRNEILISFRFLVLYGPLQCRKMISEEVSVLRKAFEESAEELKELTSSGLSDIDSLTTPLSFKYNLRQYSLISRANVEICKEEKDYPIPDYRKFKIIFSGVKASSSTEVDKLIDEFKRENELYIPMEAKLNDFGKEQSVDDMLSDFLSKDTKVLLLTGSAGSGKSMFAYDTAKTYALKIPDVYDAKWQGYIPILVFLPSLRNLSDLVSEVFQFGSKYQLNNFQINHLKQNARVLFILDAYDEMKNPISLFSEITDIESWVHAKFIVTCRWEERDKLGENFENVKFSNQPSSFQHFNLAPFTKKSEYIKKYVAVRHAEISQDLGPTLSDWLTATPYEAILVGDKRNVLLAELTDNALILSMTMSLLPRFKDQIDKLDGKLSIVTEFMNIYLKRAERKLRIVPNITQTLSLSKVRDDMKVMCIRFALALSKHKIKQIKFSPLLQLTNETRYQDFKDFFSDDKKTQYLMAAVPLTQEGDMTYQFKHETFRIHFLIEGFAASSRNTAMSSYLAEIPKETLDSAFQMGEKGDKSKPEEDAFQFNDEDDDNGLGL